ncbi:Biofilm development protein YmgB/AriR [Phytobacter ursingii]|uniref:Biofilm development regulator YmgB/AriR family protein n=1 Tax=Phytobacter ursingii TaxID=1972431 RepID=A0AB35RPJ5_9ENTR|nr:MULTISPECIES: biofilm development regulator YmgB/AriR family protein [Enterobacteriaceae]MDV2863945.1 biofilm development regulator YmgB/AriR family protein [Phytobacter ursingii]GJL35879.1 hypothetical protein TUM17576_26990 [Enterobacter hormaechei]VTP15152.1 Biofilm development protein YmgB/AriR [Phytobacter ursingii]
MSVNETESESPFTLHPHEKDIEQQIITDIKATILARKSMATNKDIILELLLRLETEKETAKLDVYRSTLERVVHATPDDI